MDQIEYKLELTFRKLRRRNLKNIPKPIEVYALNIDERGAPASSILATANLKQEIRYCKTSDDVRLAYAKVGTGPPLVRSALTADIAARRFGANGEVECFLLISEHELLPAPHLSSEAFHPRKPANALVRSCGAELRRLAPAPVRSGRARLLRAAGRALDWPVRD
jgi:hypothetical protein